MKDVIERCKRELEQEEAIEEQLKKDSITTSVTAEAVALLPAIDSSGILTFPEVSESDKADYASRVTVPGHHHASWRRSRRR
eukprot:1431238-Amphidinium_carterae.3